MQHNNVHHKSLATTVPHTFDASEVSQFYGLYLKDISQSELCIPGNGQIMQYLWAMLIGLNLLVDNVL